MEIRKKSDTGLLAVFPGVGIFYGHKAELPMFCYDVVYKDGRHIVYDPSKQSGK